MAVLAKLPNNVQSLLRTGVRINDTTHCISELVQNALDAGSTSVAVRLNLDNFTLQVIDNGFGLSKDQLNSIGTRYMTSKCSSYEDFKKGITSYGYRGEALASIRESCAVLMILSKPKGSHKTFIKVFRKGAEPKEAMQAAHDRLCVGTTVIVRDFFVGQKIRRAQIQPLFELKQACVYLTAQAIINHKSHPCADFTMAFYRLCKTEAIKQLINVSASHDCFQVTGSISRETENSSEFQFLYLNQYFLKKTKLHKVINVFLQNSFYLRDIVKERIKTIKKYPINSSVSNSATSKFAVYVINIKCPFNEYNICFERKKTLVEFNHWDSLLECIKQAIDGFLEAEIDLKAKSSVDSKKAVENIIESNCTSCKIEENPNIIFGLQVRRTEQVKNIEPVSRSSVPLNLNKSNASKDVLNIPNFSSISIKEKIMSVSTERYDSENPLTKSCWSQIPLCKKRKLTEHVTTEPETNTTPPKQISLFDCCSSVTLVNNNLVTTNKTSLPIVSSNLFRNNLGEIVSNWKSLLNINSNNGIKADKFENASEINVYKKLKTTKTEKSSKEISKSRIFKKEIHISTNQKRICNIFMSTDKMNTNNKIVNLKRLGMISLKETYKSVNNRVLKNRFHDKSLKMTGNNKINFVKTNKDGNIYKHVTNTIKLSIPSGSKQIFDHDKSCVKKINNYTVNSLLKHPPIQTKPKNSCPESFKNTFVKSSQPFYDEFNSSNNDFGKLETQSYIISPLMQDTKYEHNWSFINSQLKNNLFYSERFRKNDSFVENDKLNFNNGFNMNEFGDNSNQILVEEHMNSNYDTQINICNREVNLKSSDDILYTVTKINDIVGDFSRVHKMNDCIMKEKDLNVLKCDDNRISFESHSFNLSGSFKYTPDRNLTNSKLIAVDLKSRAKVNESLLDKLSCKNYVTKPNPKELKENFQTNENLYDYEMKEDKILKSDNGTNNYFKDNRINMITESWKKCGAIEANGMCLSIKNRISNKVIGVNLDNEAAVENSTDKDVISIESGKKTEAYDSQKRITEVKTQNTQSSNDGENDSTTVGSSNKVCVESKTTSLNDEKCKNTNENFLQKYVKLIDITKSSDMMNDQNSYVENSINQGNLQSLAENHMHTSSCYLNEKTVLNGKKMYIHSKTGMSSYISPVAIPKAYLMSSRHCFIPKGCSPVIQAVNSASHDIEQLTSPEKNALLLVARGDHGFPHVKWRNNKMEGKSDNLVEELLVEGNVQKENWEFNHCMQKFRRPYVFDQQTLASAVVLGQVDSKFLAAKLNGGTLDLLVLFDQHAVDERIRLEKLSSHYRNEKGWQSTTSLNPSIQISMSEAELVLVQSFKSQIQSLGLEILRESTELVVTSVPTCLFNYAQKEGHGKMRTVLKDKVEQMLKEQIQFLNKTKGVALGTSDTLHSIICYEACHGAIKFGDRLNEDLLQNLISELSKCNFPFQCAHGRPVLTTLIELPQIDKELFQKRRIEYRT